MVYYNTIMPPKSKTSGSPPPIVYECTAQSTSCQKYIKKLSEANIHPLLKVLICRKCFSDYGDGDFASLDDGVDEMGDDNFCRWCADGGDLFGCTNEKARNNDRCHYTFCKSCVQRNLPNDPVLDSSANFQWFCYACDPTPLQKLQEAARDAMTELKGREKAAMNKKSTGNGQQANSSNEKPTSSATKTPTKEPSKEQQNKEPEQERTKEPSKEQRNKEPEKERAKEPSLSKELIKDAVRELNKDINKEKDSSKESDQKSKDSSIKTPKDGIKPRESREPKLSKDLKKKSEDVVFIKESSSSKKSSNESINEEKQRQREKEKEKEKEQPTKESSSIREPKEFIKDLKNFPSKKRRLNESSSDLERSKSLSNCFTPLRTKSSDGNEKSIPVEREDLMNRVAQYRKSAALAVKEMQNKLEIAYEMFESKATGQDAKRRKQIDSQLDSFDIPLKDFETFRQGLRQLNNSS